MRIRTRSLLAVACVLLLGALIALWKTPQGAEVLSRETSEQADPVSEPAQLELPVEPETEVVREALSAPATSEPDPEPPVVVAAATLTSWCRVLAADTGQPVADAKVTQPEGSSFAVGTLGGTLFSAQTDNQGYAELQLQNERHAIAHIAAEGFGPVRLKVGEGHETRESAFEIRVSRAATLVVRITDAASMPIVDAQVRLRTPGYAIARPEGELYMGPDATWSSKTDENGICTLTNLPAEAPLAASATHGKNNSHKEASPLVLAPGELRELEWSIGSGSQLSGWLLDQAGRPVVDRELWLLRSALSAAPNRERFYFYWADKENVAQRAKTDEGGRFSFDDVSPGQWFVGPAPRKLKGLEPNLDEVAAVATAVTVRAGRNMEGLELRVQRGLYIVGQVTTPTGDSAEQAYVICFGDLGIIEARFDHGAFLIGPAEDVAHSLYARAFGDHADSELVEAWPGKDDVVLELKQGGALTGRCVDAQTGEACEAKLVPACLSPPSFSIRPCSKSGFSLDGLAPGLYSLTAYTSDGLIGVLRNIEVQSGATIEGLEIRLEPGAKLRVRYTGPEEYAQYTLLSDGARIASNSLLSGTTELETVPAGRIVVRLAYGKDLFEEREVDCLLGEELEVVFVIE